MKYRVITGMIGVSVIAAALSGCSGGAGKGRETEPQSIVIADMEIVTDLRADTAGQTESETSGLPEESSEAAPAAVSSQDIIEETAAEETQPAESAEPETDPQDAAGESGETEPQTQMKQESESRAETEQKTEALTERQTEEKQESEPQTEELQTEETEKSETEKPETEKGPGAVQTEKKQSPARPQSGKDAEETEEESETQTEEESESQTEEESEAVTEAEETEEESETQTEEESESQPESEVVTEAEETEEESETETETEDVSGLWIVDGFHVNVRQEPTTEADAEASVSTGMKVYVIAIDEDWAQIRFETQEGLKEGYIKTEFLTEPENVRIVKERLNARKEASEEAERLTVLSEDDMVILLESVEDGWAKIHYADETETQEAYVKEEYLEEADFSDVDLSVYTEEQTENAGGETDAGSAAAEPGDAGTPAGTGNETVPETPADTGSGTAPAEETETSGESEKAETEQGTAGETETEASEVAQTLTLQEGAEGQFELFSALFPEAQHIGVIYSSENTGAQAQVKEYETLAEKYGYELMSAEIEAELDIDLVASEMVDSVDGIFCLEDSLVDELLQTVCAYANEVGVPVVGLSGSQVDQGCLAAYEGGTLHWNEEEAAGLGLGSAPQVNGGEE